MTKREYFAQIRELVADNEELVAFIDHEVELLNRKSATPRKPTKAQQENAVFKANILEALEKVGKPVSIKELVAECPSLAGLTNQRITHLLTALIADDKVAKEYVKKVPFFFLTEVEE